MTVKRQVYSTDTFPPPSPSPRLGAFMGLSLSLCEAVISEGDLDAMFVFTGLIESWCHS